MKLVLDTNIYCDYAEGAPDVVEAMAHYGEFLFIPSVALGELSYAFMKGRRQQFNERKLRQVINRLKMDIIDVNADVARKYGMIFLSFPPFLQLLVPFFQEEFFTKALDHWIG